MVYGIGPRHVVNPQIDGKTPTHTQAASAAKCDSRAHKVAINVHNAFEYQTPDVSIMCRIFAHCFYEISVRVFVCVFVSASFVIVFVPNLFGKPTTS